MFDLKFSPELLLETLPILGMGMLGIFIVTLVIIGCVMLFNRFTAPGKNVMALAVPAVFVFVLVIVFLAVLGGDVSSAAGTLVQ